MLHADTSAFKLSLIAGLLPQYASASLELGFLWLLRQPLQLVPSCAAVSEPGCKSKKCVLLYNCSQRGLGFFCRMRNTYIPRVEAIDPLVVFLVVD